MNLENKVARARAANDIEKGKKVIIELSLLLIYTQS
jgi:hypothetical protein